MLGHTTSNAHRAHIVSRAAALAAAASLALVTLACGGPLEGDDRAPAEREDEAVAGETQQLQNRGDRAFFEVVLPSRRQVTERFGESPATFDPPAPVRQVSLMFDAPAGTELEARAVGNGGRRGPWRPVETTWREETAHVARAIFTSAASRVEVRSSTPLDSAYLEFSKTVTARTDGPLTRDLPPVGVERNGDLRTTRQLEAPRSLVIPRQEWGARDPNKICGSKHSPYRMSIHHTYSPSDDGGDPAKRMRQMQAYHIDNRGWCDIGYHFVVSQSGKIYQGRSTEKRTGAHVGGENTGNIGISHIGNFESQTVGKTQFEASTKIVHWVHSTYNIPLDRNHVKGHTEWPGQSTSCPGKNMLSRLSELLRKSANPGGSSPDRDIRIQTTLLDPKDPYDQGSSDALPDAFPGDSLQVEVVVTNQSSDSLPDVHLGYSIGTPYLEATDYTIYDDHPEHDRRSWEINDADSAEANPESLDSSGSLTLHKFSAGESKRVRIDVEAATYSLGAVPHPDVRAWVRKIQGVYETKESWDDTPSTDRVGTDLRDFVQVDVPSRDEWRFDNTETPHNLEGWTGCCEGEFEELKLNHNAGVLAMRVTGPDPQLLSPDWTRIDAETYDELVLRVRSHDDSHPMAVSWKGDGESWQRHRTFRLRAPGDGEFQTLVVPLGRHANWSGTVTGLRIDPLQSGRAPADSANGWYDIDGLYFRSSETGATTTEREAYPNATTVDRLDPGLDEDDERADPGAGTNSDAGGYSSSRTPAEDVRVKGCTTHRTSPPVPSGLVVVLLGIVGGCLATRSRR